MHARVGSTRIISCWKIPGMLMKRGVYSRFMEHEEDLMSFFEKSCQEEAARERNLTKENQIIYLQSSCSYNSICTLITYVMCAFVPNIYSFV